jgi:plastocyanin
MVGVDVVDFTFAPNTVTIHQGDAVHWVWDMNNLSTTSVAGLAESWNSGIHKAKFTFDHLFTHVGTFPYYSMLHGLDKGNGTAEGMAGTVVVLPQAPLTSIMVMPVKFNIRAGATQDYMAMGVYSDNVMTDVTSDVTWASSNDSVATVSGASGSMGMVAGIAPGIATISATLGPVTGSAPVTVAAAPPALVSLAGGHLVLNREHHLSEIILAFDGAVSAREANSVATYHLDLSGSNGLFAASKAKSLKLRSASYSAATDSIVLILKKPFAFAKPVRVTVLGVMPSGLHDLSGRLIDGDHNGQPGGNAVAVLRRGGITIT